MLVEATSFGRQSDLIFEVWRGRMVVPTTQHYQISWLPCRRSRHAEASFIFLKSTMESQPYNPSDKSIWYNDPELKKKVLLIQKQFGEPFLITKSGELLYEHCVVIPAFRGENPNLEENG